MTIDLGSTSAVPAGVRKSLGLPVSVKVYGAVGDGVTDDRLAIQAAIDSLTDGGTVYFPPGLYKSTGPLDLDDTNGVTLQGPGSGIDREATPACELRFTATGSTPQISARRSEGFTIRGMAVRYGSDSFTGRFIDVRGDETPTYHPTFDDVLLGGTGGAVVTAETVVDLGNTVEPCFRDAVIARAQTGLIGYDGDSTYAFALRFYGGRFVDIVVDAVRNPHGDWQFFGTVFENATDGAPAGFVNDDEHLVAGLVFHGGGFYDASEAGAWLDLYGNGLTCIGMRMECDEDVVLVRVRSDTGLPFNGVSLRDNQVIGPSTAIFFEHVGGTYVADFVDDGNVFLNGVENNVYTQPRIRHAIRPDCVTVIDTTTALIPGESGVWLVDTGSGPITVTMPDVLDPVTRVGAAITLKNTGDNGLTVEPVGGQRVDGAFSVLIPCGGSRRMVSDGTAAPGGWQTVESAGLTVGGVASVSNGGSIPHGMGVTPTRVSLTSGSNGAVPAVVGLGSVNIDVGLLDNVTGGPVGPFNVYWTAGV